MSPRLDALRASVARLEAITGGLSDAGLAAQAYPEQWTVADVLSHIGSSAVINLRLVDDSLAGQATPGDFAQSVWDEWNAKSPRAKAADALTADRRHFERLASMGDEQRSALRVSMGPLEFGFDDVVGMRLNEHVLHTWDIEVVRDPAVGLPTDAAALIIDNVGLIARYTGRPTVAPQTIAVRTTEPERGFVITTGPERVTFEEHATIERPDTELPAEAFVRLVYGRLAPSNTPPLNGGDAVAALRGVFPGP
jgi:uncharacterized protein (TIGR03083 family)